ncbi:MAG: glycoside hydrolase family 2 TIM barrel-domain containing protein [Paludibacter sp.]
MISQRIKILLLSALSISLVNAQYVSNWGLNARQKAGTLPQSRASVILPEVKSKTNSETKLVPLAANDFVLTSGWELAEAWKLTANSGSVFQPDYDTKNWYNATVPGTVLTTLVDQGIYPEPYFGVNNLSIPDSLCRTDWWYRISFRIPENQVKKTKWLKFDGINYRAEIWLNDKRIGKIDGAFRRDDFNISDYVNTSNENILAVHILPPPNPGIPHEESPRAGTGPNGGQLCLDGPTFISSEGWDWMPGIRDRNIGIWQPVHLYFTDKIRITDTQVITSLPLLPDTTLASVTVRTSIVNNSNDNQTVKLYGEIGKISFIKEVSLFANEQKFIEISPSEFKQLNIEHPDLWWPNGYGRQVLQNLQLKATVDGQTSDEKNVRFGIREMSYELSVDLPDRQNARVEYQPIKALAKGKPLFDNTHPRDLGGNHHIPALQPDADAKLLKIIEDSTMKPYLVIKVNGQRIYCRGGNWGMDDAMKRSDRKHLEPYFLLHQQANLNMIRNWTGESTEEVFYDLCDEYGLLVWNDFWLSTQGYNLTPNDHDLFLENALDVIIRFRNHPSIALWNPRNEGYAPKYIEEKLNSYVARYDGTRLYQSNSINMNLKPSGPWNYFKDPADYFRNNAKGFNTEQGTPSVPTAETMRSMMAEEDTWPIGDVWYYHDLHDGQKDYIQAIESKYGTPANLDDFCKKAQFVNYDSHRAMFESWNSRLWNNTSGLLLWMTHPAWPSTVWQIYSYDYETFGSFYGVKKACEPVHIQYNLHDDKVVVLNTTLKNIEHAKAVFTVFDINGKEIYCYQQIFKKLNANSLTECFTPVLPSNLPETYLTRVALYDVKNKVISLNEYWKSSSDNFELLNQLKETQIEAKIIRTNKVTEFELTNNSTIPAIGLKPGLRSSKTGERILPAIFSDGYFTLLPHETRRLSVNYNATESVRLTIEGYNVASRNLIIIK